MFEEIIHFTDTFVLSLFGWFTKHFLLSSNLSPYTFSSHQPVKRQKILILQHRPNLFCFAVCISSEFQIVSIYTIVSFVPADDVSIATEQSQGQVFAELIIAESKWLSSSIVSDGCAFWVPLLAVTVSRSVISWIMDTLVQRGRDFISAQKEFYSKIMPLSKNLHFNRFSFCNWIASCFSLSIVFNNSITCIFNPHEQWHKVSIRNYSDFIEFLHGIRLINHNAAAINCEMDRQTHLIRA